MMMAMFSFLICFASTAASRSVQLGRGCRVSLDERLCSAGYKTPRHEARLKGACPQRKNVCPEANASPCTRPAASATELRPRIRNGRALGPPGFRCPRGGSSPRGQPRQRQTRRPSLTGVRPPAASCRQRQPPADAQVRRLRTVRLRGRCFCCCRCGLSLRAPRLKNTSSGSNSVKKTSFCLEGTSSGQDQEEHWQQALFLYTSPPPRVSDSALRVIATHPSHRGLVTQGISALMFGPMFGPTAW